jgi:hypothetical protein
MSAFHPLQTLPLLVMLIKWSWSALEVPIYGKARADGGRGSLSVAEYVSIFVSIVVGLALADLLISFHRLLRVESRVQWYWLVPALAVYLLMVIVSFWWGTYYWLRQVQTLSMAQFLPTLLTAITIFLLSAAVLPDEVPEGGIELKAWYLKNSRQIWILASIGLLLVIILQANLLAVFLKARGSSSGHQWLLTLAESQWDNFLSLGASVWLIFTKRLRVHELVVVLGLIDFAWTAIGFQIG